MRSNLAFDCLESTQACIDICNICICLTSTTLKCFLREILLKMPILPSLCAEYIRTTQHSAGDSNNYFSGNFTLSRKQASRVKRSGATFEFECQCFYTPQFNKNTWLYYFFTILSVMCNILKTGIRSSWKEIVLGY